MKTVLATRSLEIPAGGTLLDWMECAIIFGL